MKASPSQGDGLTRADLPEVLPRHVAFIMDGNGRWARGRGLPRLRGHESGATSLGRITRFCRSIGIAEVTFYALSTENYAKRPRREVSFLLRLLTSYLISERPELLENGIRLRAIGRLAELPKDVLAVLRETERLTEGQTGMILRLALNYGGRQEILDAVGRIAREAAAGGIAPGPGPLEERLLLERLYDPEMTEPDLLVRTAGEMRLSNFLLWHASYSEIWVTPRLWPDFDVSDLRDALEAFATRERKLGAVSGPEDGSGPREATEPGPKTTPEGTTPEGTTPEEGRGRVEAGGPLLYPSEGIP